MYCIDNVILTPVELTLRKPFKTAHHIAWQRPLTIVELRVRNLETHKSAHGIGEIQSFEDTAYTLENQTASRQVIDAMVLPIIYQLHFSSPQDFAQQLASRVPYGSFAKAGIEMAVWDAVGKLTNQSLVTMIHGVNSNVPVSIALGLDADIGSIQQAINQGYQRIKLKINGQQDVRRLLTSLRLFPNQLFSIDANSSLTYGSAQWLKQLPDNVLFIEQPFSEHDFVTHAKYQNSTTKTLSLDESIGHIDDIETMIALQSARAVTIKQGKIGGITAALQAIKRVHQVGIKPWIGGMLSSNIGRAVDLALASLPEIAYPSDVSNSDRYFEHDLTEKNFNAVNGLIVVPNQPGIGVDLKKEYRNNNLA